MADRVALDRFTPRLWLTGAAVLLTLVCAGLHVSVGRHHPTGQSLPIARPPDVRGAASPAAAVDAWRIDYWAGDEAQAPLTPGARARRAGLVVQIVVFASAAIVLLLLRSSDPTAQLSVLALALSGAAGAGPLFGAERLLPAGLGAVITVFTWLAGPVAFPVIALAILYFPSPSPLLARYRWLPAAAFAVAAPMIATAALTSLFLVGVDGLRGAAIWDAAHPAVFFTSFALALALNVAAIAEGVYRYRYNHDANERRRIRMAVVTGAPAVLAFAVKDGTTVVASLAGRALPDFPPAAVAALQAIVLLPAFGLTYAVGVARVLGPRVVLRRSIQYALATRTLTALAVLPGVALVVSVVRNSDRTVAQLATGGSGMFLLLLALSVLAFRYRDRAQRILDERFFREEYDARKILVALATRVRFETDPADLSALVVHQIDEALHPERTAMLASGIEDGRLVPVTALHGDVDALDMTGGLVSMLRWSDEPLEIFLDDPRSPARRLPAAEIEWLRRTGAVLLVPVLGQERALAGVLALGAKRSEEAYTSEDRELLGSIAAQVGIGLDVPRLRRRTDETQTIPLRAPAPALMECPRCGRCEDPGATICPADGAPLVASTIPRLIDEKYRVEQLLGRGGMGAVYRARDVRLDRLVAVKVVRGELLSDADARRRFRREAQIVARLQHPGIVSVFDYGTFLDGGAYLVMELVRGENLRRVLQREGRLDPERALRIVSAVCGAMDAAHGEGVLHRDLKPENILLPGGSTVAKVLDFGVAKLVGERGEAGSESDGTLVTAAGLIVGTPAYMAPEQLRGETPDARTDVFALGVIAYEMLTGELPFGRTSLAEVVLAQDRGARPLVEHDAALAPEIDRVVRRALSLDAAARPASAGTLAAELARASGDPV